MQSAVEDDSVEEQHERDEGRQCAAHHHGPAGDQPVVCEVDAVAGLLAHTGADHIVQHFRRLEQGGKHSLNHR